MNRRDFLKLLGMTTVAVAATGLPVKEVAAVVLENEFPGVTLSEAAIVALETGVGAYGAIAEAFVADPAYLNALGFHSETPDREDLDLFEEN